MECYFNTEEHQRILDDLERGDPFDVSDESLSSEDWFQWGVSAHEFTSKRRKPNTELFCFDGQSADIESPQEPSIHECSSLVGFSAGNYNSYLLRCGFVSDQPDFQPQNECQSSSAQMDDIFLYSFFEGENLKTATTDYNSTQDDELADPSDNWATEYGILCWTSEDSSEIGGSTTSKAPTVLIPEQLDISGEVAVIQELEAAVGQLNPETRVCLRDAFYRLAGSLTQSQLVSECGSTTDEASIDKIHSEESRTGKPTSMGTKTYFEDKIIAELLLDRISSNQHH
ncbi:protein LNK4-like [Aristolochia californica]|uniref:protein LNK4-like n=1 Tax=Aristolochia californica TaxID=171875 RepID=UPI0035DAD080